MATELKRGQKLVREVESKQHDARKTGALVWTIDNESIPGCPMIRVRPKGCRAGKSEYSTTLDSIYSILVKKGAI